MKKILSLFLAFILINISTVSYAEFYTTLPSDIGSNSKIMEILYPEEKKTTSYSQSYLISCMAEPGTEITLYIKDKDNLFVPLLIDNKAVTGVVGESGLYLIDMNFRANSTNRIMFFAQKGKKYQSEFRTITIKQEEKKATLEYKAIDIQEFVNSMKNKK